MMNPSGASQPLTAFIWSDISVRSCQLLSMKHFCSSFDYTRPICYFLLDLSFCSADDMQLTGITVK